MQSDIISFASLLPALPELLLVVGAIFLLMLGVFTEREDRGNAITTLAVILLILVGILTIIHPVNGLVFNNSFIQDDFARYMKLLVLIGSAVSLIMAGSTGKEFFLNKFEYPVLILLATVGMMMMISANDLLSLYLGIELQSLALYVVAALKRDSARATEAGLKYFVLGALSSGLLLYGASLVYGFTGQTEFGEIARIITLGDNSIGLTFGLVFLLAGIAFKISAVPFHMWTPDVYEGVPTPVTAFFASAPKVAAMAMLVRLVMEGFKPVTADWQQVAVFLALASMVLAAFAAIGQTNIKRLIAFSSIGHVGTALVGLAAGSLIGIQGVAIYMAIYLIMTLGVFACLLALRTEDGLVEKISSLSGLGQSKPFVAAILAMFMFSLVGLPPLAGFFAKWQVFLAAIEAKLIVLAIVGVLSSAVSAFYYLRVIKVMYFDEPQESFVATPFSLRAIMAVTGLIVLTYFFTTRVPIADAANQAAASFF